MRLHFEQLARSAERELARRLRATRPAQMFGFELEAAEPGRAVLRMKIRRRHIQLHGVVHGGVIAALADTVGALGVYLMVPKGTRLATIEMKINYLETVDDGTVLGESRVLRLGKRFAVTECEVRDSKQRLVAKALATYAVNPPPRTRRGRRR